MSEERKAFEAAILEANGQVPGNYNPEYDRYVSERRQGQYEGWKLARAQLPSQGGEAVAWMHSRSGAVATAATKSAMEDGSIPSGYDVPLYTHPADQVAEGVVVPETWQQRLKRMNPTVQEGKWPKRWIEEAKDDELRELRALLAKP